jgi:transketolase
MNYSTSVNLKHEDTNALSTRLRLRILDLCHMANSSHIGGAYSVIDVLVVLYLRIVNVDPRDPGCASRDRVFYSKGHACTALYSILEELGFFTGLEQSFSKEGTYFTTHVNHKVPGVELSTGSLGLALSVATGTALAAKRKRQAWRTFVIVSDGELDEGSNWEPILFAPHHKLDNLVLIVDYNKIQSFGSVAEVLGLEPLGAKFAAFGWRALEIDGHDHGKIEQALLSTCEPDGRPSVLICHTIKGKGVSFMENNLAWHYKSPNAAQVSEARLELAREP